MNQLSIILLLFIDFRKAFDLVNSDLLLKKLKLYGFNSDACRHLQNYFDLRSKVVKFSDTISDSCPINLVVSQGSCLGPILFLIYINDLPKTLQNQYCTMFADDSTCLFQNQNLDTLLHFFI